MSSDDRQTQNELERLAADAAAEKRGRRHRIRALGGGLTLAVTFCLVGAVPGVISIFITVADSVGEPDFSVLQICVAMGGPALGWLVGEVLAQHLGRRKKKRVVEDLSRLPFPVRGLDAVLGAKDDSWTCEIDFVGELPDSETLQAAASSVSAVRVTAGRGERSGLLDLRGPTKVVKQGGRRELETIWFDCALWLHAASAEMLPALHERYPIAEVRLRR